MEAYGERGAESLYEAGDLMNLSFKMLLACETAFVYFQTFSNRFQVVFLDSLALFANARSHVVFAVVFVCMTLFVVLVVFYYANQRRLPKINLCA